MSNGTVSNRISSVVSAIVAHLHITNQEDGTTLQDVYRKKSKLKPCAAPTKAYQLRPVKDCTASRRQEVVLQGGEMIRLLRQPPPPRTALENEYGCCGGKHLVREQLRQRDRGGGVGEHVCRDIDAWF